MKRMAVALCTTFALCGSTRAMAGGVPVPSDISIALTAAPSSELHSGQRIDFTISVTNHGPEPVIGLTVGSSPIYDELDVFSASSTGCQGDLVLAVADLENSFYFVYNYYVVRPDTPPMEVGATYTCQLSLDYTPWAPLIFPVIFDMSSFEDLDPSNNSAQVLLRRAVAAQAVPSLSATALGLLIALLVVTAWMRGVRAAHSTTRKYLEDLRAGRVDRNDSNG